MSEVRAGRRILGRHGAARHGSRDPQQRLACPHVAPDPLVLLVRRAAVELEQHAEASGIEHRGEPAEPRELLDRGVGDERCDMNVGAVHVAVHAHKAQRLAGVGRQGLGPRPLDDPAGHRALPIEVGLHGLAKRNLALDRFDVGNAQQGRPAPASHSAAPARPRAAVTD